MFNIQVIIQGVSHVGVPLAVISCGLSVYADISSLEGYWCLRTGYRKKS